MSGHPINPLSDQFHKATAPTPGFRGATTSPSASELTHHDHHPVHQDSLSTNLGRGGGHSGTQGCPHRMAHNPDKVSARQRLNRHIAPNGGAAQLSESLSSQPPQPARLRVYSQYGPTRTTVQPVDRSQCGALSNAAGTPQHGTPAAYKNFRCRCPDAREAERLDRKRFKHGVKPPSKVDPTAAIRRLQALGRIGWRLSDLAVLVGVHKYRMGHIRSGMSKVLLRCTDDEIRTLYYKLADTPGPCERSRQIAARAGWAPPAGWDEETIGDPNAIPQHQLVDEGAASDNEEVDLQLLLAGRYKVPETFGSRVAHLRYKRLLAQAVDILTARGLDAVETAKTLKTTERSIVRYRKLLREQRQTNLSGPRAMNNSTVGTTPSTGTPREAHVA